MVMTLTATGRPYRDLGRRIAALRKAQREYGPRGMSQRELASRAGISEGYVPTIEGGTVRPTPEILRRIAGVLGVEYTDLATIAGYVDKAAGADDVDDETLALARRIKRLPGNARRLVDDMLVNLGALITQVEESDPSAGGEPERKRQAKQNDQHGTVQP